MRVDAEFIGGPFDGINTVKDEAGFSWVIIPHNGKMALYTRRMDGRPYRFIGTWNDYTLALASMRILAKIANYFDHKKHSEAKKP